MKQIITTLLLLVDFIDYSLTLILQIGNLVGLRYMHWYHNALLRLPHSIGHLHLQSLILHDNYLVSLPPEIGRLTTLRVLDVSSNSIDTLPEEIGHLTALEVLNLESNDLERLPTSILFMKSLEYLYVDNNSDMKSPSLGIIAQGVGAVKEYLKEEWKKETERRLVSESTSLL